MREQFTKKELDLIWSALQYEAGNVDMWKRDSIDPKVIKQQSPECIEEIKQYVAKYEALFDKLNRIYKEME